MTIENDVEDATSDALWTYNGLFDQLAEERRAQDAKWSEQNHPDGTGSEVDKRMAEGCRYICDMNFKRGRGTWKDILLEETYEAFAERNPAKLREELLQVAAVALNWAQAIDRRRTGEPLEVVESWGIDIGGEG